MLAELLRQKIQKDGPLSLYDYMALCLYHPQAGYYMQRVPMGEEGDFITAPEISQLFGEMIGVYLLQYWEEHLKNTNIHLVECGPGKGTLMKDILRVFQLRPTLEKQIKLLEISPALQSRQQQTLHEYKVEWHTDLEQLLQTTAPQPLILIANEFLDALPVNQYTYTNAWHQRHITWENNAFAFCWKPCDTPLHSWPKTDDIYEHAPGTPKILQQITRHLKSYGGIAIFIDYGHISGTGDTLQGMRSHQYASILDQPGQTDLTSHVNFGLLKDLAETQGCVTTIMTQGAFLAQLGIHLRAQKLMENLPMESKLKVQRQIDRLTKKMGELFKVLVVQTPT